MLPVNECLMNLIKILLYANSMIVSGIAQSFTAPEAGTIPRMLTSGQLFPSKVGLKCYMYPMRNQ